MKSLTIVLLTLFIGQAALGNQEQMERFTKKTQLMFPESQHHKMVQHIPLEMVQFYLAMGISEFWHCSQNDSPLACTEYLQMMSDPVSHLGFVFFMMASRSVSELAIKTKVGPQLAGYLGLASGMLVQTVFEEIYRHPDMQIFLKTRYIQNKEERQKIRKEALSNLYNTTFGDKEWYIQKFPMISSLLLAAGFSPILIKSVYTLNGLSYKTLKRIVGADKFKKLDNFLNKQVRSTHKFKRRISVKGLKVLFNRGKTTRLAPVIYTGEFLIGTITFLELHHLIDDHLSKIWRETRSKRSLKKTLNKLKVTLEQEPKNQEQIHSAAKASEEFWDNYRLALSEKSFALYARHVGNLNKMEQSKETIFRYYTWLARGMDFNDEDWIANENQWHAPSYDLFSLKSTLTKNINNEIDSYLNELFCGTPLNESIEFKIDYSGVPIPFIRVSLGEYRKLSSIMGKKLKLTGYKVKPYRIIDFPGTCEKDIRNIKGNPIQVFSDQDSQTARLLLKIDHYCPIASVDGVFVNKPVLIKKEKCLKHLKEYRHYLMKYALDQNQILSRIYEDYSERIPDLLGLFKTQKLRRYERDLQKNIVHSLGEKKNSTNFQYSFEKTVLASYQNEINYWNSILARHPELNPLIIPILETTKKELKAAQELKKYIDKPIDSRDPSIFQEENVFEEASTWESFWRGLILN